MLRKAGVDVRFKRPVNKTKLFLGALSTIFSLFGAYIIYRYATAILNPKFLWAVVTGVSLPFSRNTVTHAGPRDGHDCVDRHHVTRC